MAVSCDLVWPGTERGQREDGQWCERGEGLGEAGQAQSPGTAPTGIMCHGQCPESGQCDIRTLVTM